ncbi:MAG: hypothetical protein DMG88_23480 [Acidobacteria bacterium]|nr:MAG: hypothetical protein DMG88_23480 [Acidobacteriota bacterium]
MQLLIACGEQLLFVLQLIAKRKENTADAIARFYGKREFYRTAGNKETKATVLLPSASLVLSRIPRLE